VAGVLILISSPGYGDDAKDIRELTRKGSEALAKGSCREARDSFRKASESANNRAGALDGAEISRIEVLLGESEICFGDVRHARDIGDEVLKRNPPEPLRGRAELLLGEAVAALGQLADAERHYATALEIARRIGKEAQAPPAVVLARLAGLNRIRGAYSTADGLLDEARKTSAGPTFQPFSDVLVAVESGDLARSREEFETARKYYERAVALAGDKIPDHALVARAQQGLGELSLADYDLTAARRHLRDAQTHISRFAISREYLSTADALARVAMAGNDLSRAAEDLNSCLNSRMTNLGENSPETADSLDHIGWLRLLQGRLPEASDNLSRADRIRQRLFGPDHEDVAFSQLHLGILRRKQGNLVEAERRISDALRILSARTGEQSLAMAEIRLELARVYLAEQKNEQAMVELRRSMAVQDKRMMSAKHPIVLSTLATLGAMLQRSGRNSEAEPLLARWMKESPGTPANAEGLQAVLAMAELDLQASRFADAERRFGQVLQSQQKTGAADPELQRKLALALERQGKIKEAIAQYEAGLTRATPSTASAELLRRLGSLYASTKDYGPAANAYRRALDMWKQVRATENPAYAGTLLLAADAYLQVSRADEAGVYAAEWRGIPIADSELDADQIAALDRLSVALTASGKPADAEPYLRLLMRAAEDRRPAPLLDGVIVRLADACVAAGKKGEAAGLYERGANARIATRRYADAESLLLKAKSLREGDAAQSMEYASMLRWLSYVYIQERKFAAAKPLLEQARAMLTGNGQAPAAAVAGVLDDLGVVAKSEQAWDKAESFYNEANQIIKTEEVPKALASSVLFHLGELAEAKNNSEAADQYFTACLATARESYSKSNPPAVEQFDDIANIYMRHGRNDEAEQLHESTMKLRQEFFGEESIEATWGFQGLASFYNARKKYDKAVTAAESALRLAEKNTGLESEVTRVVLGTVADVYKNAGNMAKAMDARTHALEILSKTEHSREEETAQLIDLADYCRETRQYAKASEYYKRIAKLWSDEGYRNLNYVVAIRGSSVLMPVYQGDLKGSMDGYRQLSKDLAAAKQGMQRIRLMENYRDALRMTGHDKEVKIVERDLAAATNTPGAR
jgi:tetratricopeptide (TPR) repeat protein